MASEPNCLIRNRKTGEIKPAFDCDQTYRVLDENGDEIGADWEAYLTPFERGMAIAFVVSLFLGIAVVGAVYG